MSKDEPVLVYSGPLMWVKVDRGGTKDVTAEDVLEFIHTPGISSEVDDIVKRYKEIQKKEVQFLAAPYIEPILEKIVWPLRHAKASFIIGNYWATIALCGMVAEMMATILFEISEFKINNCIMKKKDEELLFGSKFEKLRQQRRVKILHGYKIIDDKDKRHFDSIREVRNKYLHRWSLDYSKMPDDAIKSYHAAVSVVVNVMCKGFGPNGEFLMNPSFLEYVKKKGISSSEEN